MQKKNLWLWILGWLIFFPIPLTVLIVRSGKLGKTFEKKKRIPDERLIEPNFQTVSIALETCRHCITNDELRRMFVNLICNSMDSEYDNKVHPSFPEMIKQMSTLDARILQSFTDAFIQKSAVDRPFSLNAVEEIVLKHSNGSYETVYTNMFYADIPDINYDVYKFSSSITHLERLSLVDIDYGRPLYEKRIFSF